MASQRHCFSHHPRIVRDQHFRPLDLLSREQVIQFERAHGGLAVRVIVRNHKRLLRIFADRLNAPCPAFKLLARVEVVVTRLRSSEAIQSL